MSDREQRRDLVKVRSTVRKCEEENSGEIEFLEHNTIAQNDFLEQATSIVHNLDDGIF
jgi:hypothetical protein